MTIEIDDAGTGDPLLGAVIGFYRQETGEIHFEWIPIEAYQEGTYYKDLPQEEAAKAVMRGLLALNIKEDEGILLCKGSIFDKARESLDQANIKHEPLKIEGKLQDAVEEEYIKAVEALGIRSKALRVSEDDKDKGYRKRYFVLLNWAKKKPEEREKHVKNGLPFWKYAKDQKKPIPGGWKKARKEFESDLEQLLKQNAKGLTWDKLKGLLKQKFPTDEVLVNHHISIPRSSPHDKDNGPSLRLQVYNSLLGQVYCFLGQSFGENAGDAVWKSVMWNEVNSSVNGIVFYIAKDVDYKANLKWFNFLRPFIPKVLGNHVRVMMKPF